MSILINAEKLGLDRLLSWSSHHRSIRLSQRTFPQRLTVKMSDDSASTLPLNLRRSKKVWIWTECKEVMTVAVERGWNTFLFTSDNRQLSDEWSCIYNASKNRKKKASFLKLLGFNSMF